MPLQTSTIQQAYHCSQDELYATSLLIVESYKANQALFATKKSTYTVLFGTNLKAEILAAKTMLDFQQRGAAQEVFKTQMETAANEAMEIWKELESLIRDSFPADQYEIRRQEAGSTNYTGASHHNWESVSQLMLSGQTFITTHGAALTTGGMLPAFPGDYDTAKDAFDTLYTDFKNAEQNTSEQRDEKITANNTFYKKITNLCEDGQKYYRNEPAKRERFTFSKVLELVSGHGSQTIEITIPSGGSVTTDGVYANSPIINTGTIAFHVCAGSVACNVATSVLVQPADQVSNTFGPQVTITNPSPATEAKASLRVVE